MKTLSEAVQVQIISEAGSTYRNTFLALIREGCGIANAKEQMEFASTVTTKFVEDIVKELHK